MKSKLFMILLTSSCVLFTTGCTKIPGEDSSTTFSTTTTTASSISVENTVAPSTATEKSTSSTRKDSGEIICIYPTSHVETTTTEMLQTEMTMTTMVSSKETQSLTALPVTETTIRTTTKITETTPIKTTMSATTTESPEHPQSETEFKILSDTEVQINGIVYHYEPKDAKLRMMSDCSIMSLPSENSDVLGYTSMYVGGFMSDMLIEHEWYHVIYDGKDAFVRYEDDVDYYETIAGDLYFNNGLAVVSCYTYDIVNYDYSDALSPDDFYFRVTNANSKSEVLNIIHQKFSARYDDYNRGETSGDPRENDACAVSSCIDRMYKESNGKVYVYAGEMNYFLDYAYAEYEKKDGNEVWFTMTAERAGKEFVSKFSMLLEDDTWKIGAATYPRY